jgi:DNA-directed RNA polymerase sigma subunit (sigma70/sigma32)
VELRFGLSGREAMSYASIGAELRISTTRVRQIEAAALRQLAQHRAVRDLRGLVA